MTFRKLTDRGMRGVLFGAALVSSAVILLIIGFLFKEGAGIIGRTPIEYGNVLVAHAGVGVSTITAQELRSVSEEKITDWSRLGGAPLPIAYLNYDDLDAQEDVETLVELVARTDGSIASVFEDELKEASAAAAAVERIRISPITLWSFLTGSAWYPTSEPAPQFGILALILGSLLVTVGAIVVALPVGLAGAVYLSEVAHPTMRAVLKPTIEVLAGIPSVVFGFFGLVVVVPFLQRLFNLNVGETALAGIIMLAIMSLPTIVTVSEDALTAVPRSYREASLALGATRWQTISRVVVPAALSGVTAAAMLGVGRAVGETMTVLMVTGNAAQIPTSLLVPVRTLTATIAAELGEAPQGGDHYMTLFAIGIVLFVLTFLINLVADLVSARYRRRSDVNGRLRQEQVFFNLLRLNSLVIVGLLAIILWFLLSRGAATAFSWPFLSQMPREGMTEGGILPAIVGTLLLTAVAIAVSLPLGVLSAIYLNEYAKEGLLKRVIRLATNNLAGVPSVVFGLFGMALFVKGLGFGTSILAGGLTLALVALPVIIRTTEESLKTVPKSYREASLALGATQWQTVRRVVLPAAASGILTGSILSVGRVAGETAPILFTAAAYFLPRLPHSLLDQVMALPYHLYVIATSGTQIEKSRPMAYGTAVVLLMLVTILNLAAVFLRNRFRKMTKH